MPPLESAGPPPESTTSPPESVATPPESGAPAPPSPPPAPPSDPCEEQPTHKNTAASTLDFCMATVLGRKKTRRLSGYQQGAHPAVPLEYDPPPRPGKPRTVRLGSRAIVGTCSGPPPRWCSSPSSA